MFETFAQDIEAVRDRDPAAGNTLEILLAYPGLHALWLHRLAHWLWERKVPVIPRLISHCNRWLTGIEIHPGAKIGKGVFIDHGMGVVIGETAEVGDYVTLYQGVTLGGTGKEKGKRHPTVGKNVVIAAGAKVLGPITVGDDSKVGAGAVVVRDVPPRSTVVGVPGKVVMQEGEPVVDLHHEAIPDPVSERMDELADLVGKVREELKALRGAVPAAGAASETSSEDLARRLEELGDTVARLEGEIREAKTAEAAEKAGSEAMPGEVSERIDELCATTKKLEDYMLKIQLEVEITQEKLRRAEAELRRVEERLGELPEPSQ